MKREGGGGRFIRRARAVGRWLMRASGLRHEPGRFQAADRVVRCPHCGGEEFYDFSVRGRGLMMLGNRGVRSLMCVRCERIEWFARGRGLQRLKTAAVARDG